MNKTLITIAEADAFLLSQADWLALPDEAKLEHIAKASVYVQTAWECVDVDWTEDPPFISDVIKEAVAYYSLADSTGNLYGDVTTPDESHGSLRGTKDKVGSLSTEVTYFKGGTTSPSGYKLTHGYPDALMATECTKINWSKTLTRN